MAGSLIANNSATLTNGDDGRAIRVVLDGSQIPLEVATSPGLPPGFISINTYGTVASVAAATLTDIVTHTVPVGKTLTLARVEVSGENIAKYQIDISGSIEAVKRTWWGDFNADFEFERLELTAGTVIKVQGIHTSTMVGDFDARIIGIQG